MSRVRLDVSQSRGHGFENHPAPLLMSGKFVYLTLPNVYRVKDRSRRKRKEASQVVNTTVKSSIFDNSGISHSIE